ncbi:hypothetical protein E2C01_046233 [Portunus trituberculatus]|uniref:Uncharacterized protein n=1 Tax=Portunus trituberculatus TaxID=210409 RepID=A0A5B7G3U7_PORTR|nr:hypothetical protein [Portunus trituberculatus]
MEALCIASQTTTPHNQGTAANEPGERRHETLRLYGEVECSSTVYTPIFYQPTDPQPTTTRPPVCVRSLTTHSRHRHHFLSSGSFHSPGSLSSISRLEVQFITDLQGKPDKGN